MSFKTVNLGDLHPLMCAAMNFVAGLRHVPAHLRRTRS